MDLSGDEMLLAPYLGRLVERMREEGHEIDALSGETGVDPGALQQPDARLPLSACLRILDHAERQGVLPRLGMEVARELDLRNQGFLGYAVLASADLGEALDIVVRYLRTRTRLLTVRHFIEGEQAVVQFQEGLPLGAHFIWLMDGVFSAIFHIGEQMFRVRPPREVEVRLPGPQAAHHELLREGTGASLRFDSGFAQVRFPRRWLSLEVTTADPSLMKLAAEQCERELQRCRQGNLLLERVRELTEQYLGEPQPMEAVAGALHMTPRTLRRRLAALGTTHQQILEELRRGTALDLLQDTDRSVEEIADSLGYTDPSNFGRAFRRWTGMSPRAWRKARVQEAVRG